MIHAVADEATHVHLKVALADLSSLVGWAFHDTGQQAAARRYLMNALTLARDADQNALVASVLYRLGRVSMHQQQPLEALRLLQLGQMAAQEAGDAAEIARLHANEALAHAMLGQEVQVKDSLARAEFEMGRVAPGAAAPWAATFFAQGDFTGHQALIYNALANSTRDPAESDRFAAAAADLAATALASSGPERPIRSWTFDRIVLATSQLRTGELEVGLTTANQAVTDAQRLKSVRATQRLSEIGVVVSGRARKNPEVRELCQRIVTVSHSPDPKRR